MDNEAEEALKQFFSAQKKLNQLGIIHSRDYIGDIGRYLCQAVYDMEPVKSPWQAGYDGTIDSSKVQVRINNCPHGTPVRLAEPAEYDEVIVVLGPNCFLRPENVDGDFIFYRFTREEALKRFKFLSGRYVGGKSSFAEGHDKVLNLR